MACHGALLQYDLEPKPLSGIVLFYISIDFQQYFKFPLKCNLLIDCLDNDLMLDLYSYQIL